MSPVDLDESTFKTIKCLQDELEEIYVQISRQRKGLEFAKSFLGAHFKDTSNQLRDLYIQHYQTLDNFPHRDWFKQTYESLEDFAKTFSTRSPLAPLGTALGTAASVAQGFVAIPWLIGWLALGGISTSYISELVSDCFCHGMSLFTVCASFLILSWLVVGFQRKRQVLVKRKVYEFEERLLNLLGSGRKPEIQLDVFGWLLCSAVLLVGAFFLRSYSSWWFLAILTVGGFISLVVAIVTLIQSRRRPWAWSSPGSSTE
jgi:hypothetical protein